VNSQICVVGESGDVIEERRIYTDGERFGVGAKNPWPPGGARPKTRYAAEQPTDCLSDSSIQARVRLAFSQCVAKLLPRVACRTPFGSLVTSSAMPTKIAVRHPLRAVGETCNRVVILSQHDTDATDRQPIEMWGNARGLEIAAQLAGTARGTRRYLQMPGQRTSRSASTRSPGMSRGRPASGRSKDPHRHLGMTPDARYPRSRGKAC
jgi:hypothetical protein